MSFAKGEFFPKYADVDSDENSKLPCSQSMNLEYETNGKNMVQILDGSKDRGFVFAVLEFDKTYGASIGFWQVR